MTKIKRWRLWSAWFGWNRFDFGIDIHIDLELELEFDFGIDDIHVDLELKEGRVTDDFFITRLRKQFPISIIF